MKGPDSQFNQYEEEGVPKVVADTAAKIAFFLGGLSYDCEAETENNTKIISFTEDTQMTPNVFSELQDDFAQPGVKISFDEDRQVIVVAPVRN
ncbi:MAG: hypothetical protein RLZZ360_650 [Candidatus Parcubacteria bacterium]|jgi:hypothetical protein